MKNTESTLKAIGSFLGLNFKDLQNPAEYSGAQFHFHAPSEHSFDGVLRDLEVHFVNSLTKGSLEKYTVIGITF